jgi:cell division septation protein DedD
MGRESTARKRSTESRLIFTALGVTVWIAAGFLVGLVAGVVSEEPELLVGHMAGRDTEIAWAAGESASDPDAVPSIERTGAGSPLDLAPVGAAPRSVLDDPRPAAEPVLGSTPRLAEAPPPPAPAKATASDAPRFLIQVGAYDSRDSAQEVAETLRGKGYAVRVLTGADDGRFRVRVGPVVARDRAEGLAKRLETDEGLPTWILRAREG